jgi:hypothetical protein
MRIHIISGLAAATLMLSACGGGEGEGGGGGDRSALVDQAMDVGDEEGFEMDKACVTALADQLSDEDVKKILNDDTDVSPEAMTLATQMMTGCGGADAMVDRVLEEVGSTEGLDAECFKNAIEDADPEQLAAGNAPELQAAMLECMSIGG